MRPELMVAGISDLHDARYCAAVGIERIVLRIGDGTNGTIPLAEVHEIAGWLSGTSLVLDIRQASQSILPELETRYRHHPWLVSPDIWRQLHQLVSPEAYILDATGYPVNPAEMAKSEAPVEWIIEAREAHRLESFEQGHRVYLEGSPEQLMPWISDPRYRYWYLGTAFVSEGIFDYQACDLFLERLSVQAGA